MAATKKSEEQKLIKDLEFTDGYVFNPTTKQYVIFLKSASKPIVIDEATFKSMLNAYSGEDQRSVEEICATHSFPKAYFDEMRRIFKWSRDGLPLTDEDILSVDSDELVEDLLEKKRFEVGQKFQKKDWKQTQENSERWVQFEMKNLNPFVRALENWNPPKFTGKILTQNKFKGDPKTWVAALSDLHYGAKASECYMYSQKGWDTHKTIEAVKKYSESILRDVKARNYNFEKAIILGMGDLIHSLNGKTGRGTELKYDYIREEQFDYAFTSLAEFIANVASCFPKLEIRSLAGNHNYESEICLFRALAAYFRNQKNIEFYHYSTRPASFRTGNTLFLIDHGADSGERAYVPSGPKLQTHVQSLLLQKPELLQGVKTRIFAQGDKHHWHNEEFNDFEFIMFSTSLVGDEHASVNNLNNRARQSSLILDEGGLKEIIHCYFD